MNKFNTGDLVRMRGSSKNPVMVVTVEKGAREGVYNCSWWAGGYNHLTLAEHELESADDSSSQLTIDGKKTEAPAPWHMYHRLTKQVFMVDKSVGDGTLLRCTPIRSPNLSADLAVQWIDSALLRHFPTYLAKLLHCDVILAEHPESGIHHVEDMRGHDWHSADFLLKGHGWVNCSEVRPVGYTA